MRAASTFLLASALWVGAAWGQGQVSDPASLSQNNTYSAGTTQLFGTGGYTPATGTTPIQVTGTLNGDIQISVQNLSSGTSASSDFVATANNGTDTTHYVDFGINGSNGGAAPFTGANAGYAYSLDAEFDIGALGTSGALKFWCGGGTSPTTCGSISGTGWTTVGTVSGTSWSMTSAGLLTATQITGLTTPLTVAQGGTGLATTSQNFAFIGPTSGSGAPTWRALVAGDIPSLSATYCALAGCTMAGTFTAVDAGTWGSSGISDKLLAAVPASSATAGITATPTASSAASPAATAAAPACARSPA